LDNKAPDAFRTISEVADDLDVPQHVLRFWESRFREIKPMKRGGGRRYYRPDDVDLLRGIRYLLYGEGYTIRGVQRILREQGPKFVQVVWQTNAPQPPHHAAEDDDIAAEETAIPAELEGERGLLGRLPSLIGRDLRDDGSELAGRREPPLQAAPEPRIEAADRTIHGRKAEAIGRHTEAIGRDAEAMPVPAALPAPAIAARPFSGLPREDLRKLQAALHELGECRRLIDAALVR
jgi:DNA-binding transcriptional MerR regulator